jgi:hypothetical protein
MKTDGPRVSLRARRKGAGRGAAAPWRRDRNIEAPSPYRC